jgi:hypothetical protein
MKDNLHAIRESELQQVSNVLFDRMKKHDAQVISDKIVIYLLNFYIEEFKKNHKDYCTCNGVNLLSKEIDNLWEIDHIITKCLMNEPLEDSG